MAIDQNKKLKNLTHALKDKASIIKATLSIPRRSSSIKVAVVRATTHGSRNPPSDARVAAVLALGNDFRSSTAFACIEALMERLHTTSSAAVAMKSLFTLHIIVIRGPFNLRDQVAYFPCYGGRNFLNLSTFRDVSDSEMNDLSSWVRWYAGVVESNVIVDRKLDRILYFRSRNCEIVEEQRKRKIDVPEELEVLVGFVERICEVPESLYLQKKDLVYEVVRLVLENYRLVQREIWVRVKEIGDRVESLSLDELTELVGIMTRLENCRRKLSVLFVNRGKNEEFWELVKITKGKLAEKKRMKEEKRMIMVEMKANSGESTRLWNPFVEPGQLLWVPAGDGPMGPALLPLTVSTVG
ncbi:putative clathrin assembly protein At4g40080 [Benincasa hispida]|uniref:putative clathrin assembly protein At4g40080 n=1 Tax=Benincasa hispida TaxID=102211 RepID=UPI0019017895|nr:putative clathrin assembly protein At4g40080 [Benincasa hispida]